LKLNEENLFQTIQSLNKSINQSRDRINELERLVAKRATEKVLGDYFERICTKVNSKELAEKPHRYKMNDPGYTAPDLDDPDAQHLRAQVDCFIERLDQMLQSQLTSKKIVEKNMGRVQEIEDTFSTLMTKMDFRLKL